MTADNSAREVCVNAWHARVYVWLGGGWCHEQSMLRQAAAKALLAHHGKATRRAEVRGRMLSRARRHQKRGVGTELDRHKQRKQRRAAEAGAGAPGSDTDDDSQEGMALDDDRALLTMSGIESAGGESSSSDDDDAARHGASLTALIDAGGDANRLVGPAFRTGGSTEISSICPIERVIPPMPGQPTATVNKFIACATYDGTIALFNDLAPGDATGTAPIAPTYIMPNSFDRERGACHTMEINAVVHCPIHTLATASVDGTIRLWSMNTGRHVKCLFRGTAAKDGRSRETPLAGARRVFSARRAPLAPHWRVW